MMRRVHSSDRPKFVPQLVRLEERSVPSVQMAGEFSSVQFAPDSTLNYILWNDNDLTFVHRAPNGTVSTEIVATETSFGGSPVPGHRNEQAQLVYTSDATPHIFFLHNGKNVAHYRRTGTWQLVEDLTPPIVGDNGDTDFARFTHLTAVVGSGNRFHLALLEQSRWQGFDNDGKGAVTYGTGTGTSWTFQKVADITDPMGYFKQAYEPRYFSLAVDLDNFAHITYTPGFIDRQNPDGTLKTFSNLAYASNRGGAWTTETVYTTGTGTDDAALGASVAVGPGGQISVASFLDRRVATGSPSSSQLLYHTRQANGTWTTETAVSAPDGYFAGDGAKFTGFAPQLKFDAAGKPVILFSDHASHHFPATGADEFAGQTRLAVRNVGGWSVTTLFHQTDPIHNQVLYPTMAWWGDELVTGFIRRKDTTGSNDEILSIEYFWELRGYSASANGVTATTVSVPAAGNPYAVGSDAGAPPQVKLFRGDGTLQLSLTPYSSSFTGGVHVAVADMNGDGVKDVITAPGFSGGPHIRIFSGVDGSVLREFMAYSPTFTGGVWLACGDVNGDGTPDLLCGAGQSGGPHVRVFSGVTNQLLFEYMAYAPTFTGGILVASADVNGDGRADIITGAGPTGGPHVRVMSGVNSAELFSFFAFGSTFTGGIFVSAGDVNGDGKADIIVGAGNTGNPRVGVFSGANSSVLFGLDATDNSFHGGVRVAAVDRDGDGKADIVTTFGSGLRPLVRSFFGATAALRNEFLAFDPAFEGGVFVG